MLLVSSFLATGSADGHSLLVETTDRPWVMESEFVTNPALHAIDGQTVVLRLESGRSWGSSQDNARTWQSRTGLLRRNSIRFLVEEKGVYRFCIPSDEPHLRRLVVRKRISVRWKHDRPWRLSRPLVRAWRGGRCKPVTLRPGSYVIEAFHDVRRVLDGKTAFLRLPDDSRLTGDPLTAATARLSLLAWKGPNGKFVTAPNGDSNLIASATEVDEHTVWKLDGSGTFTMTDGVGGAVQSEADDDYVLCPPPLFVGPERTGPPLSCSSRPIDFYFSGASSSQFRLIGKNTAYSEDGLYGYDSGFELDGSAQVVSMEDPVNVGIAWTVGYRGFTCASGSCDADQLSLQAGEVALFTEENYQGTAFVFASDVSDLGIYAKAADLGLAITDDQVKSIRVGPGTLARLFSESSFAGDSYATAVDNPSLEGLAVGPGDASSLQVEATRTYLIDSGGCAGCDLTEVDLSGLDLASADFSGTNLTGANLAGTSLFGANLDDAVLAQAIIDEAELLDTSLRCTNLSDTDLTSASVAIENDAVAAVSDETLVAVVGVDLYSGGRTVLTGAGTGAGDDLSRPKGLAAAAEGLLLVDSNRLLQVADGERSLVSSTERGSGPRFLDATDVAVAEDGSIFVADRVKQAIIAVDPGTGDRTVVSNSSVGNGLDFLGPYALAISEQGVIYVTDAEAARVLAVDPTTGDRSVISDANTGSGPALQGPGGILVDSDGSLLITDVNLLAVMRIAPSTGDRTMVSGAGTGNGPAFTLPTGIAAHADGSVLVVDSALPGLFELDPATGDRQVVSGPGFGGGPNFAAPVDVVLTGAASLSGRIATDLSCRLILARAILTLDILPANLWRYADLRGATIDGAAGTTLSTSDEPLDLSGAILNGVDLAGTVLDAVDLGCTTDGSGAAVCSSLQGTDLSDASLKAATMTGAQLQGASLSNANLDGADLTSAKLLGLTGGSPATLSGAFLRGASLAKADLTGVIANNLNFYSISGATADATDAVMTGAKFNNAYLAGADFSGATLQSTEWNQAVLVGANFTNADLSKNETAGEITDFGNAYLHGTVFANADVTDANFDGSFWDLDPATTKLNIQLQRRNLGFAGYWNDPTAAECVQAAYPNPSYPSPSTPATDASNICPDGELGSTDDGCEGAWEDAPISIGDATPPGAVDPALPGSCTNTDILWLLQ
jgi:uncharacterized protein YjbI with pentapeptide repeats/sugar lactone lactonase YvrE